MNSVNQCRVHHRCTQQRDKDNVTGIQNMQDDIKNWVKELEEGLKLSIAHYEQKLKEPGEFHPDEMSVTVGSKELPVMDDKKMKEIIHSALNTFSLIQFNLVKVKELLSI